MNMNMKKKILALAIASSLAVPQVALAAEDTSGMHYTSASEGFYASIRAQLSTSDTKSQDGNLDGGSSRFGVHGTNDLGGGLEGFYTYEAGININQTSFKRKANDSDNDNNEKGALRTRLGNVGLRGGFGEIVAGTFWVNSYNWTYGGTDIANQYSGNFAYTDDLPGRQSRSVQYTSPDLSGFQVSGNLTFNGDDTIGDKNTKGIVVGAKKNDVDQWAISAKYDIQGFSLGASYLNRPEALAKSTIVPYTGTISGTGAANSDTGPAVITPFTDTTAESYNANADNTTSFATNGRSDSGIFVLKAGYAQDNWYVNGWYGQDSAGDTSTFFDHAGDGTAADDGSTRDRTISPEDTEFYSIAAGVSIDKISLYALYENRDMSKREKDTFRYVSVDTSNGTLGVQYNLGSNSRVYLEYASRDDETKKDEDDSVLIGLRHDF